MSILCIKHIYIPCGMCTFEFMGITDGKKEKMIFALKPSCYFTVVKKERERCYTLTTGLYNQFQR